MSRKLARTYTDFMCNISAPNRVACWTLPRTGEPASRHVLFELTPSRTFGDPGYLSHARVAQRACLVSLLLALFGSPACFVRSAVRSGDPTWRKMLAFLTSRREVPSEHFRMPDR